MTVECIPLGQGSTYVKTAFHRLRIGATADGPKLIRTKDLPPADIVVVPDEPWIRGGVGVCAFEFDFWGNLFSPEGFFANGRPLTIVCLPEHVERIRTMLSHAYRGPSAEELNRFGITDLAPWDDYRRRLGVRSEKFGSTGQPLPLERAIKIVEAGDGFARVDDLRIGYRDEDQIKIIEGTKVELVSTAIEGSYQFPFPLPVPDFHPAGARLAVHTLGCYPGMDPTGGTTCFKVVANGINYIVDGMAGLTNVLHRLGDGVHGVEAVCLSHCHQDHLWHAIERMLNGEQIRLIAAPPVYTSFVCLASAITGWPEDQIRDVIRYSPITPESPIEEYGVRIEAFWVVGPVPTTGFRFLVDGGSFTFSSDTLSRSQMVAAGLGEDIAEEIVQASLSSDFNIVDGGGAGGDPVHGKPADWIEDGRRLGKRVVLTHTSLSVSATEMTAPGKVEIIVRSPAITPPVAVALTDFALQARLSNGLLHALYAAGEPVQLGRGVHVKSRSFVVAQGSVAVYEASERISILQGGDPYIELGAHPESTLVTDAPTTIVVLPPRYTEALIRAGIGEYLTRTGELKSLLFRSDGVELAPKVVDFLAVHMAEVTFHAGDRILTQGTSGDHFYVLKSGRVVTVCHKALENGSVQNLIFGPFGPGYLFGDVALMTMTVTPRTADVISIEDSVCYQGDRGTYNGLTELSPGLRYARINKALTQAKQRSKGDRATVLVGELTPERTVELVRSLVEG